jgi:sensor histidine kinase regulating citrate/malate metabolism
LHDVSWIKNSVPIHKGEYAKERLSNHLCIKLSDDGGGMDPQAMRHCMGFGFSDKKSDSAIGRYGNGFKTSTMRLGADVIVFSRHSKNQ